jgi:hypothetical protein
MRIMTKKVMPMTKKVMPMTAKGSGTQFLIRVFATRQAP